MSFETSIFFVHVAEGGDNLGVPTDLGGHTVFGISERSHPKDDPRYRDFWADPTWPRAKLIYFREYWEPNGVAELPEHYQAVHFDCLVNHNPRDAVRIFQSGLGGLVVDGVLGERTRARAWQAPDRVDEILAARSNFYLDLVQRRPDQEANWDGWLRRSIRLALYAFGVRYHIPIHPLGELDHYEPRDTAAV